jgi:hypothetical protein
MRLPRSTPIVGLAVVALAGGSLAVAAAADTSSGDRPQRVSSAVQSDDSSTSSSPSVTSSDPSTPPTTPSSTPSSTPSTGREPTMPGSGDGVVQSPGGTVTYAVQDGSLSLVSAVPASGWSVEVEQSAGRELEVDFRAGATKVDVHVELEDGQVRERVRVDDDDDDARGGDDDNSGPGSDDSGRVDDHDGDDNSGPGSGDSGHVGGDDDSGHGGDDDSSGPG